MTKTRKGKHVFYKDLVYCGGDSPVSFPFKISDTESILFELKKKRDPDFNSNPVD